MLKNTDRAKLMACSTLLLSTLTACNGQPVFVSDNTVVERKAENPDTDLDVDNFKIENSKFL